ncbi:MAG TPA: uracil-DNA glycosylase [Acidimicrobiales bacterium]|nr:uracil-DNA glycosylase [Acidimicrobiales bacterium]
MVVHPERAASPKLEILRLEAERCVACVLSTTRSRVVFGSGSPSARLMFVGEAPGREEDLSGLPFVGRSGQLVVELLGEEFGIGREACYIANVVKCRPPANRNPRPAEIGSCAHFLERQIALVAPALVMTLGNVATRALLARREGISELHGRVIERDGYQVLPTFHPAAAFRSPKSVLDLMRADFRRGAQLLGGTRR